MCISLKTHYSVLTVVLLLKMGSADASVDQTTEQAAKAQRCSDLLAFEHVVRPLLEEVDPETERFVSAVAQARLKTLEQLLAQKDRKTNQLTANINRHGMTSSGVLLPAIQEANQQLEHLREMLTQRKVRARGKIADQRRIGDPGPDIIFDSRLHPAVAASFLEALNLPGLSQALRTTLAGASPDPARIVQILYVISTWANHIQSAVLFDRIGFDRVNHSDTTRFTEAINHDVSAVIGTADNQVLRQRFGRIFEATDRGVWVVPTVHTLTSTQISALRSIGVFVLAIRYQFPTALIDFGNWELSPAVHEGRVKLDENGKIVLKTNDF